MGLGKTLQTLMLVLSNPPPKGWAVNKLEGHQAGPDAEPVPIRTTLVVVPANLLSQVTAGALGMAISGRSWYSPVLIESGSCRITRHTK
jgi:hypothetical protein